MCVANTRLRSESPPTLALRGSSMVPGSRTTAHRSTPVKASRPRELDPPRSDVDAAISSDSEPPPDAGARKSRDEEPCAIWLLTGRARTRRDEDGGLGPIRDRGQLQ